MECSTGASRSNTRRVLSGARQRRTSFIAAASTIEDIPHSIKSKGSNTHCCDQRTAVSHAGAVASLLLFTTPATPYKSVPNQTYVKALRPVCDGIGLIAFVYSSQRPDIMLHDCLRQSTTRIAESLDIGSQNGNFLCTSACFRQYLSIHLKNRCGAFRFGRQPHCAPGNLGGDLHQQVRRR